LGASAVTNTGPTTILGDAGVSALNSVTNPAGLFIFQIATALTTASNSAVTLLKGNSNSGVFCQTGSSATLGTGSAFVGNILSNQSITLNPDSRLTAVAGLRVGHAKQDADPNEAKDAHADPSRRYMHHVGSHSEADDQDQKTGQVDTERHADGAALIWPFAPGARFLQPKTDPNDQVERHPDRSPGFQPPFRPGFGRELLCPTMVLSTCELCF
jgi:hypothetical protein